MSWFVKSEGKPDEVVAAVERDPYVPNPIKACVKELLGYVPTAELVQLETNGHMDTTSKPPVGNFTLQAKILRTPKVT